MVAEQVEVAAIDSPRPEWDQQPQVQVQQQVAYSQCICARLGMQKEQQEALDSSISNIKSSRACMDICSHNPGSRHNTTLNAKDLQEAAAAATASSHQSSGNRLRAVRLAAVPVAVTAGNTALAPVPIIITLSSNQFSSIN